MAYLDHNAITPVDVRVLKVMMPLFAEGFGNPSSSHASGRVAAEVVENARRKVAGAVGMGASDVIFTSGATEANNLALTGLRAGLRRGIRILAGATEHKSVLQTLNPHTSMAEICREHNLVPRTVYGWKEKFLAGGRSSLDGPDASKQAKRHKKEISSLKRIIGEYAVANDALKKRWRAGENERRAHGTGSYGA